LTASRSTPNAAASAANINRADVVGKVVRFDTRDPRGLVASIRIARTQRGDDTLQLASEDMLSASVGFGVHRNGEVLDRFNRVRRVTSAWLDHIALVMSPVYSDAKVLAVRLTTPHLDKVRRDPIWAWAFWRTDPVVMWADRRLGRR
jgi:phage head maturation protease